MRKQNVKPVMFIMPSRIMVLRKVVQEKQCRKMHFCNSSDIMNILDSHDTPFENETTR